MRLVANSRVRFPLVSYLKSLRLVLINFSCSRITLCVSPCNLHAVLKKQGLSPISNRFRIKTTIRWFKHGDEEAEDFLKVGQTQYKTYGGYGPQVTQIAGVELKRNKTWQINVVADPNKLLHNIICYNYVGGNALSGGRKIFISKEKFTNWLNERNNHSNIGVEKESNGRLKL